MIGRSPNATTSTSRGEVMTEKVLLTPEETAETLSIGRTKVYELLALGVLRSVQIGKSRRIPVAAVHELVDRLSEEPGTDDLDGVLKGDPASTR
jgi:excisionase family DNA binding protein